MDNSLAGLRVIVTAGASGIGRATAEAFLSQRAQVHVCDISEGLLADFLDLNPHASGMIADVADPGQVDAFVRSAIASMGGVDVLVNNAGIAGPTAHIEQISAEDWQRTLAVGIHSQFYCTRRVVPTMKAARSGSIVNLSSTAGLFGYPLRAPYAAAKWAVIGFTKTLAMELGPFGIRVNAICPGAVDGPRMDQVIAQNALAQGETAQAIRQRYLMQTSLRTFVRAEDIAAMILFLCSTAGGKISGQALSVDGNTETLRT